MLALNLSEEGYCSCIDQTVILGALPFVWKSFPNICSMLLGGQIGTRWGWVGQSFGAQLQVPLGQDELTLSLLTSAKPRCFCRPGCLLRQWIDIDYAVDQLGKKFIKLRPWGKKNFLKFCVS